MKKFIVSLLAVTLLGTGMVFAKYKHFEGCCKASIKANQDKHLQKRMKKLTKTLNLTSDQQQAVEGIMREKWDKKAEAYKQMKETMTTLHTETSTKIRELLKPEQQEAFEKFKAKHHGKKKRWKKGKKCCGYSKK